MGSKAENALFILHYIIVAMETRWMVWKIGRRTQRM